MNIFYTSECPLQCAKNLDDKRVVKMCLETAQLLSTAIHKNGGPVIYKPTHANHPCTVWAASSIHNFKWLIDHFIALLQEYSNRYNKVHKSSEKLYDIIHNMKYLPLTNKTPHPNCAANSELNISYKHIEDTALAYKLYMNDRWDNDKRTPTWHREQR